MRNNLVLLLSIFSASVLADSALAEADKNGLLARLQIQYEQQQEQLSQMRGQIEQLNYQVHQLTKQAERASIDTGINKPIKPELSAESGPSANRSSLPSSHKQQQNMQLGDSKASVSHGAGPQMTMGQSNNNSNSQVAFEEARRLLDQRRFAEAEVAFTQFIRAFPNDPLLVNAYYWVGETYYIRADYTQAVMKFGEAYQLYQQHKKFGYSDQTSGRVPEIMLKLGMSLANIGKVQEARIALAELEKEFPQVPGNLKHQIALLKLELDRKAT